MRPCLQKPNQKNTKGTKTRNSIFVCFATFLYFKFLLLLCVCMAMVGGDICVCHGAYAEVRGQLWNQFSPFSFACVLGIKCRSSGLHSKHLCPRIHFLVLLLCCVRHGHWVAQAGLSLPSQPLDYWDHGYTLPQPAETSDVWSCYRVQSLAWGSLSKMVTPGPSVFSLHQSETVGTVLCRYRVCHG